MLPSEKLELHWVNKSPDPRGLEECLVTVFTMHWRDAAPVLQELIRQPHITSWNDTPGRTKAEAVAVARLAEMKLGLRPIETGVEEEAWAVLTP